MSISYETVIGLEVHTQLKTKSKIFCGCSTVFDADENVNTCPVCTGMPGSLPVLNRMVVEYALRMALATGCRINFKSFFARKNYFYPDLPKGYQISQYDAPLAEDGFLEIEVGEQRKKIRLIRIHIEEDAGKNIHRGNHSYLNLNRAGVPLIEIVSHPDIRSAEEASNMLKELKKTLRYLKVSDGNMEEGNFRCDVNISLRPEGSKTFGTRTEIKNINSFRFVEKAIKFEIERQKEILGSGQKITQETRLWDSESGKTHSMRSKEAAHDYRYFPEPDLLPIEIDSAFVSQVKSSLVELPLDRKKRLCEQYGLSLYDATLLIQEKELADYFEEAVVLGQNPKLVSNWILSELLSRFGMDEIGNVPVSPKNLGELVKMVQDQTISGKIAKTVFEKMIQTGKRAFDIVKEEKISQISDVQVISEIVDKVLKENTEAVKKYHAGNQKLWGFFIGEVMKASQGKANPKLVNQVMSQKLGKKDQSVEDQSVEEGS